MINTDLTHYRFLSRNTSDKQLKITPHWAEIIQALMTKGAGLSKILFAKKRKESFYEPTTF